MAQARASKSLTSYIGLVTATVAVTAVVMGTPWAGLLLLGVPVAFLVISQLYWVVLFLIAYVPFESLVLKFVPVPDQIYLMLQFVSEVLIYSCFVALVLHKLAKVPSFRRTPIDLPILAFVGVGLLSIFVNRLAVFDGLVNLRALLRYVVLFYLVVNLDLSPREVSRLLRVILIIGWAQMLIGGLQIVIGRPVSDILLPRQVNASIGGHTRAFRIIAYGREYGSIFGTLGDTVFYGMFMVVILALYLARIRDLTVANIFILVLITGAIGFSYSRAALFGAFLLLWLSYRIRFGMTRILTISLFVFVISGIGLVLFMEAPPEYVNPEASRQSVWQNITGILSPRYFEIAQKQRFGFLVNTVPAVLLERPILGYGPDTAAAVERLNTMDVPLVLENWGWRERGFKDVYWITILAYYGLAGLLLSIVLFLRLYSAAWRIYKTSIDKLTRQLAFAVICLVGVTAFLLFFNEALEFRAYGFYFWLLAALMFQMYSRERRTISIQQIQSHS